MKVARETSQSMQRVKVGLVGLCAVILLIALTSVIMGSVAREKRAATVEQTGSEAANAMAANEAAVDAAGEPLAELGVSPSANTQGPAARK